MTGAIIILYNFSPEKIPAGLAQLCLQTDVVCLVDNSQEDSSAFFLDLKHEDGYSAIHYIPLCANTGIAHAQNVGITYLLDRGCTHILFSDDDSVLQPGTVTALRESIHTLREQGINVGGVSPRAYNRQTVQPYPYPCNFLSAITLPDAPPRASRFSEVTDLISSGTLTTSEALRDIGMMEAGLFIDGVDSEWCWRGRSKGWRFFVNEDLRIDHQLGMGTRHVAGRNISLTPPYRMYYMYRNYLRLIKRTYVPFRWKWHNGIKYLMKAVYYPIFGGDAKAYISNIIKGIKDA